jgi:hypothetical protein
MKEQGYQIVIAGQIDESWSDYFSGLALSTEGSGMTRLSGEVADQSALHGLLSRIRDLNLKLVSIQLLANDGITPVRCCGCQMNGLKDD